MSAGDRTGKDVPMAEGAAEAEPEVGAELQPGPAPETDGICAGLGILPSGALVAERALAAMLGRSVVSIKRAVTRGELPPPVRILGCPRWTAGSIVRHIEKRLDSAARKAERKRRESEGESP